MRRVLPIAALVFTFLAVAPLEADDLTGAGRVVCSALQVAISTQDGDCEVDLPANLNVPQFIEIDLESGHMSTTVASGLNRATTAQSITREDGLIILQGFENGRAFSLMITEQTGLLTAAVAREGLAVTAFGACTPLPGPGR